MSDLGHTWMVQINTKANQALAFLRRNFKIGSTLVHKLRTLPTNLWSGFYQYVSQVWDPSTKKDKAQIKILVPQKLA